MLSALRAHIKRRLIRRLCYDASVRVGPEELDLAAGETRHEVEWIRVQPDVDLKLYWKVLLLGSRFSGSIVSVPQMATTIFF